MLLLVGSVPTDSASELVVILLRRGFGPPPSLSFGEILRRNRNPPDGKKRSLKTFFAEWESCNLHGF